MITNAIATSSCNPAPAPNAPWKLSPVDTPSLIGVTNTARSDGGKIAYDSMRFLARRKTSVNIFSVNLPVEVFCWLGW
jgi:hypothetical protein